MLKTDGFCIQTEPSRGGEHAGSPNDRRSDAAVRTQPIPTIPMPEHDPRDLTDFLA